MAYRIDYSSGEGRKQQIRTKRPVPVKGILCAVGLAGLLTVLAFPPTRIALWNWILPGDGAVTAEAVEGMIEHLRDGVSVGDAVTAFCQEIIAGGA